MDLEHSEEIFKIKNCPNQNEIGTKKLYRCVLNPINNDSFIPYGFKPKYKDICEAWGISTYNNIETAKNQLKSLPKSLLNNYNSIAVATVNDNDGIKYQSGQNLNHYTYFPEKSIDLTKKFIVISSNDI